MPLYSLLFFLFTTLSFHNAVAAQLIMLEQDGCIYCQTWHEEIGEIYPKTDEAKIAPLRVVDIHDPLPEDLQNIYIDQFTPSFVVIENGKEVGRIRGYPGDEFFWFLLGEILEKTGKNDS